MQWKVDMHIFCLDREWVIRILSFSTPKDPKSDACGVFLPKRQLFLICPLVVTPILTLLQDIKLLIQAQFTLDNLKFTSPTFLYITEDVSMESVVKKKLTHFTEGVICLQKL